MNNINMGVPYPAKTNGPIVIYEPTDKDSGAKTGSVCVVIPITAAIDEDNNWSGKFQQTIFNKDGSPNTIGLDSIKRAFKLESLEHVLDLPNTDTSEIELDAVFDSEQYNGRDVTKVKYLNARGEGGMKMPENTDLDKLKARFGSKLRALSGTSSPSKGSTKKPEPAKKTPPPTTAKKSAPPVAKKKVASEPCTMEEAWEAFQKTMPDEQDMDVLTPKWMEKIAEVHPDKEASDLDDNDWGAVKAAIES